MRFDVVTLFPELFAPHLVHGITRRAFASGQVDVRLWPLRDFAQDAYRRVDDRPYGGGPGMVLLAEPLERALEAVQTDRGDGAAVLHFTPAGQRMDQALVESLAQGPGAVIICGRYEGVDQRVIDRHVTLEISLGDFVLSGGEWDALVGRLNDSVKRKKSHLLKEQREQIAAELTGMTFAPSISEKSRELAAQTKSLPERVTALMLKKKEKIDKITRQRRDQTIPVTISATGSTNDAVGGKTTQQHPLTERLHQLSQTYFWTEATTGAFQHNDRFQQHRQRRRQRDVITADDLDQRTQR
jgi:tRNA (guanine37-N1)-methyltransferase